jgi:hypothetical protein
VQVTFHKLTEQRISTWEAVRGKRTRIPGSTMALGRPWLIPHDLEQMIVEGALGIDRGFWGSIAAGATFKSTGRKRTPKGREVIKQNRQVIQETELVVQDHAARWAAGEPTPTAPHLDEFTRIWKRLGNGGSITVEWPTLRCLEVTGLGQTSHRGAPRSSDDLR